MQIIGEKINGAIPAVARAIREGDEGLIRRLALLQAEAGADYLDICACVRDREGEILAWLIAQVQAVTDLPLCIDSPVPERCVEAMALCRRPGLLNSASLDGGKAELLFPAVAGTDWGCVSLLCSRGIPSAVSQRLTALRQLLALAERHGLRQSQLWFDPMVEAACLSGDGASEVLATLAAIKREAPAVKTVAAISNVSFTLPHRQAVNGAFLVLAMGAGLDCAILDPTDRQLTALRYAADALTGRDEHCLDYIDAYRQGRFGRKEMPNGKN